MTDEPTNQSEKSDVTSSKLRHLIKKEKFTSHPLERRDHHNVHTSDVKTCEKEVSAKDACSFDAHDSDASESDANYDVSAESDDVTHSGHKFTNQWTLTEEEFGSKVFHSSAATEDTELKREELSCP